MGAPVTRPRPLDDVRRDVTFAARTLLRTPGFAVAVASLGLAVGALSAVYSTVDWLLNRSPGGVVEPQDLVVLRSAERARPDLGVFGFSFPQYLELREVQDAFVDVASYGKVTGIVSTDTYSEQLVVELATGAYFPLIGVRPHLGRLLSPEDDVEGAEPVAVLSHHVWQSYFGGDAGVVGRFVGIQGARVRVIGVLPAHFEGYSLDWNGPTDLWMPTRSAPALGMGRGLTSPTPFWMIVGRLRPGLSIEGATERAQAWISSLPPVRSSLLEADAVVLRPSGDMRIARRAKAGEFLGTLMVVCGLILLAACFNVANFFLGRAALRQREIALRSALGASRSRILRQLLTEILLLAGPVTATGAVLGVWVASLLAPLPSIYLGIQSRTTPLTTGGAVDLRLFGLALALGTATSLVFGLVPLVGAFRDPIAGIKNPRPRWSWGRLRVTSRHAVLVLQVGLAVVLSVTAGLLARTFLRVAAVDSELEDPPSVLLARIVPFDVTPAEGTAFYEALLARLESLPQVESAAIGWNPPFRQGRGPIRLPEPAGEAVDAGLTTASPRFFETLGLSMVAGREFGPVEEDRDGIIINHVLAERLWPGQDPIGRSVMYLETQRKVVVGVVARRRCEHLLEDEGPCAWHPFPMGTSSGYLRVRTRGEPADFGPVLRELVRELDSGVAVTELRTLDAFLREMVGGHRVAAIASSGLALFGIVLLVLGCASLFVSLVRDSVKEIAIRMALGATNGRITREVASHGLALVLGGLVSGVLAARALAPGMADRFYEVSATDPVTFVTVALLVALVSMAAIGWAAFVATRTEPATYLRSQ